MAIDKQGVIEAVSTKEVKTRFGVKDTYSIKVDGEWYNAGFQKVPEKGSEVSFQYDEGRWGKEIVKKSLVKSSDSGANPSKPQAQSTYKGSNSGKGVFPIPTNDGQRSIIRQNATTNANYLIRTVYGEDFTSDPEEMVKLVIQVAREIEAYTTGDSDKEEAKRIAANMSVHKAWEEQNKVGQEEAAVSADEGDYFQ